MGALPSVPRGAAIFSTEDSLPIRWWLQERRDEITFWSRAKRVALRCHAVALKKNNKKTSVAVQERCRSVPRGAPFPFFTSVISSFFAPKPHGNACYAGYGGPRERCRSVPRGGVKKEKRKKKNDRSWTEREVYRYPSIRYK